jgi:divalent metal cation (Fe/Co/Zn/Cd) transporter
VHASYVVSLQSAVWTTTTSVVSIALGLSSHTAVLIAFGAIGFVDAIGSIVLVYHFRHGLRHEALSDRLEAIAHRIVLIGLFVVGCGAIVGGVVRLASDQSSEPSDAGVVLAAISLVVLTALSARKRSLARRVSSNALKSDAHLSAIGATQAAVTMVGTAATRFLDWHWADAVATTVVGFIAATLAVVTWRSEARH